MLTELTISQLDIGHLPPERALELGQLGYLQWLGSLPGDEGYPVAAMRAYTMARPFIRSSPAVAVFCDLLVASTRMPPEPLTLQLPRHRRGGGRARRAARRAAP